MPGLLPIDDPRLLTHLADGEEPRAFVRQHPMVLVRPAARAVGALALWLWLAAGVPAGRLMDLLLLVTLGLWGYLVWSELERRFNFIAVTDKRIFKTEGLISRRYPMMRISKVTDVTYLRTIPGRLFRYGTIIIESAGQEQALHELKYIPYPEASDKLWAELFGSRPRSRRERPRRLGLPRRWRREEGPEDEDGPDGGGPSDDGPDLDDGGALGELGESPVRDGDPRRGPRFLSEDTDVPSAGDWRAHPRPQTIYQSPDLRPRTRRSADTGPIPLSTRRGQR